MKKQDCERAREGFPPIAEEGQALMDKAEQLIEEKDSESRTRTFTGKFSLAIAAFCIIFSLFQLYASVFAALD
ncbi:MAG: hypothetical protein ACI4P0_01625, partial [Mailhella sp.]